ncbi:TauD/TfdA family dioxygenase [Undibacterium sp. Ji42W]|uniref:TauD/TfdA family dioxygenase n=1 Tax=Undibacterium sp. Ji42W TaxID=3413039 RepID=UPI003BEF9A44
MNTMPKPGLNLRRPAVRLSDGSLVDKQGFANASGLPLVLRPHAKGVDLLGWIRDNQAQLQQDLLQYGGLLFRDFDMRGVQDFQAGLDAFGVQLMNYIEKATPRKQVNGQVYTSTIFPPEHVIALHNELSYVRQWPGRIAFFCEVAAETEGETPIADVRRVLAAIDTEVKEKFRRLGWMLVRNFGSGIGPSWQHSLAVESREEAQAYMQKSDTKWTWMEGDRLRTSQVRSSIRCHPQTGEELWFNHIAFWHPSSMTDEVRNSLTGDLGVENLPYNTFYGDGTVIPDEVVAHLRAAYDAATIKFRWQPGDLLLLDNMLVAHGRSRFTGERKILTAMGDEVRPTSVLPGSTN